MDEGRREDFHDRVAAERGSVSTQAAKAGSQASATRVGSTTSQGSKGSSESGPRGSKGSSGSASGGPQTAGASPPQGAEPKLAGGDTDAATAVSDQESASSRVAAKASGKARKHLTGKDRGSKAVESGIQAGEAKAEKLGRGAGSAVAGKTAGRVAGAAAADATRVGSETARGAAQGAVAGGVGAVPGAVKGAAVGAAKSKTLQKVVVVAVPSCLLVVGFVGLMSIVMISTVISAFAAQAAEPQRAVDDFFGQIGNAVTDEEGESPTRDSITGDLDVPDGGGSDDGEDSAGGDESGSGGQ